MSISVHPLFAAGHVAFLFFCLPGLSLVCPCLLAMKHFYSFVFQVRHCWCHVAFLFICLSGLSLVVSALCRWPCSISILLSPRSVAGVSLSIGHEAFLFICLPGPSLLVPCSISIHLSFRSVTGGVRPFPLGMQHFCSFVSRVCHWCCRPFLLFPFICLPCLSLLISALFRWPCSISIHLSPRLVTGGALFRCFCSFVSQVCHCWCPPFSSATQHFYSLVSQVCHCWCPPFSAGDAPFLFICFPGLSLLVSALFRWACSISIHLFPGSFTGAAALFRWPCSISIHLSPMRFLSFCLSGLVPALLFFLPCPLEQIRL